MYCLESTALLREYVVQHVGIPTGTCKMCTMVESTGRIGEQSLSK
jgi:hypothetical protein